VFRNGLRKHDQCTVHITEALESRGDDSKVRTSFWSVSAHGGAPQLLVRFPNADRQSNRGDFAVDATRFYFAIEDRQSDVFVAEMIVK
jgi:hypothetical protein